MQARKFKTGDIAFLVESNRFVRKGRVETCGGGLVLFHFIEGGAIRVKEHRLYRSEEEAMTYLDQLRKQKPTPTLTPAFWNHLYIIFLENRPNALLKYIDKVTAT